jgi:hypothetical protein
MRSISLPKRTLAVGVGLAAAAAAATAATPAHAASKFLRDTSICPAGKVTVGGGAQVVGEGSADFKTALEEHAPGTIGGGAQSLWLTALRNNDTKAHKIGLFAACRYKPAGYQVVRKDVTVPALGFVRTTANCPVGKVVLAGGAQVVGEGSAEFRTRLQESAPGTIGGGAQSVWLAAMRNLDLKSHKIGIFAVCSNKPGGYQVVRKDTVVPSGGFLRTTANCPAGKVVMGGGASVIGAGTANFNTRMQESTPGTTGIPSVSVHLASLRNLGAKHTIGVHAVCAFKPAGYQVVRKDVLVG